MREISYNKKEHSIGKVECLPNSLPKGTYLQTLILMNECHFFITINKVVSKNKMIVMYRKTLITKVFLVIILTPLPFKKKVDTQLLNIPYIIIKTVISIKN